MKLTVANADYSLERAERALRQKRRGRRRDPVRRSDRTAICRPQGCSKWTLCLPAPSATWVQRRPKSGNCVPSRAWQPPGGVALPFSAYAAHLDSAGLADEIDAMLADPAFHNDASFVPTGWLACDPPSLPSRSTPTCLSAIGQRLRAISRCGRFIFRSSTNAEDLAGFNGAGLYESTVVPGRSHRRRRSPRRCGSSGPVCGCSVPSRSASGIASITGRWRWACSFNRSSMEPLRPGWRSPRTRSRRVGAAPSSTRRWLARRSPVRLEMNCRSNTSCPPGPAGTTLSCSATVRSPMGDLLLSESDVHDLTDQLFRIHDKMVPAHAESANAMDVEFALTAERRFVILQARPYKIVYDLDRAEPKKRDESSWTGSGARREKSSIVCCRTADHVVQSTLVRS